MGLSQFEEREPFSKIGVIIAASGTGQIELVASSTVPRRIDTITLNNSDIADRTVSIAIDDGSGNTAYLGNIIVPHDALFTGLAVEFCTSKLPIGQQGIVLPPLGRILFSTTLALVGGAEIVALAQGGYF